MYRYIYTYIFVCMELPPDHIITMYDCFDSSKESQTRLIIFQKCFISTMNDDLPSDEILHICDK